VSEVTNRSIEDTVQRAGESVGVTQQLQIMIHINYASLQKSHKLATFFFGEDKNYYTARRSE
jgi:hypothetical protein